MKMKIDKLMSIRNVLCKYKDNNELSIKTAYKMSKLIIETQSDEDFYIERYKHLMAEYGKKEDDKIVVPKEKKDDFLKRVAELDNTEIEIPDIKFALSDFSDLKLSMSDVMNIYEIIEEE